MSKIDDFISEYVCLICTSDKRIEEARKALEELIAEARKVANEQNKN